MSSKEFLLVSVFLLFSFNFGIIFKGTQKVLRLRYVSVFIPNNNCSSWIVVGKRLKCLTMMMLKKKIFFSYLFLCYRVLLEFELHFTSSIKIIKN